MADTVQRVTLTGPALIGYDPSPEMRRAAVDLPREVALGRRFPDPLTLKAKRKRIANLGDFVDYRAWTPPPSTNYRAKSGDTLSRMYLNDQYGCCVFSGKYHNLGGWSANDSDAGPTVLATDAEVKKEYFDYTGGADNGALIYEVLDRMKVGKRGLVAGGKKYFIDDYVEVDWTNKLLTQFSIYAFGPASIGINLPRAWTSNAVWDIPTGSGAQVVGGHDVSPFDYQGTAIDTTAEGVIVSSWGRTYLIPWRAWLKRPANYNDWGISEFYSMLAPLWYNADHLAPNGLQVDKLRAYLAKIGGGDVPDIEPPTPTPPTPTPPTPGPGPIPIPSIGNFSQVFQTSNWRMVDGKPVADVAGTIRINTRSGNAVEDALAEVNDAMAKLMAAVDVNPTPAEVGAINWILILMDVFALFAAYQTKQPYLIIQAAIKLLQDLGVKVPPIPFPTNED